MGVIVRSINLRLDDYPHTGNMSYGDIPNNMRVPAAAISTNGAQLLSSMLSLNDDLYFYLKQDCKNYPEVPSHNVIGEIKGSKFPRRYNCYRRAPRFMGLRRRSTRRWCWNSAVNGSFKYF